MFPLHRSDSGAFVLSYKSICKPRLPKCKGGERFEVKGLWVSLRWGVCKVGIESRVDKRKNGLNGKWFGECFEEVSLSLQKQANCEIWNRVHLRSLRNWTIAVLKSLNELKVTRILFSCLFETKAHNQSHFTSVSALYTPLLQCTTSLKTQYCQQREADQPILVYITLNFKGSLPIL